MVHVHPFIIWLLLLYLTVPALAKFTSGERQFGSPIAKSTILYTLAIAYYYTLQVFSFELYTNHDILQDFSLNNFVFWFKMYNVLKLITLMYVHTCTATVEVSMSLTIRLENTLSTLSTRIEKSCSTCQHSFHMIQAIRNT